MDTSYKKNLQKPKRYEREKKTDNLMGKKKIEKRTKEK